MRNPLARALILSLLAAAGAQAESLTLREAVNIALRENPRLAVSRAQEDAARARRSQARATWLPQVSVSESYTRGDNPVFVFGSLLEQGRFGPGNFDPAFLNDPDPLTNWRLAATLRIALFDQLRRISAIGQSDLALEQARGATETAAQATRLEVVQRFTGVLTAEAAREAASTALKAAERAVEQMRDRFSTGLIAESDLLSAQTQAAEFRQQLIEAEGGVRIARAALAASVGMSSAELPALNGALSDVPVDLPGIDQALADAREARRELSSSRIAIRQAELGVRSAAGQFLPRVDGYYSWGASGARFSEHDDDSIYGAIVTWNILDPGRHGRLAEARANRAAAIAATDDLERNIDIETITAYERARTAVERREVARTAVEQARESMRMVHDRYREGLTTITEELRAQAALLRAEMNLVGARSDVYVAYANLLRSTGRLNDVPFD
jgi:outer membrane protein